jgi:hypothetical protein
MGTLAAGVGVVWTRLGSKHLSTGLEMAAQA